LLIRAGFPPPLTQIPVLSPDGSHWYYLDMGWEDLKLAVEYDGDHHRVDPIVFAYDVRRLEDLQTLGWTVIRVTARHPSAEVVQCVRRAWDALTLR
jgi:very-short-patch-repair endonuclease